MLHWTFALAWACSLLLTLLFQRRQQAKALTAMQKAQKKAELQVEYITALHQREKGRADRVEAELSGLREEVVHLLHQRVTEADVKSLRDRIHAIRNAVS